MTVAVVTFPGSNCDADAVHVTKGRLGFATERVWHTASDLPRSCSLVVLPGGFAHGDALRAGAIARFSPVMAAVRDHAERGGLVLGICNGFQILLEAGMLPGAMLQNASRTFVSRWVSLVVESPGGPFTSGYEAGQKLRLPVAHHQGRYFADDETVARLQANNQVVFRYGAGDNPNGSCDGIAGICNERGNVLGMMPHPERASESVLGSTDGLALFRSALAAGGAR